MMHPGFGILGKLSDWGGEHTFDEVAEGYGLQDGAEVGADGDPDLRKRSGGALVLDGLGKLAPDICQRSFDGPDDVRQRDLPSGSSEPVATGGAPLGAHDPGVFEIQQDVLHELLGYALRFGDQLPLQRPLPSGRRARELRRPPQRVISPRRDLHALPLPVSTRAHLQLLSWSLSARRSLSDTP